MKKKIVTNYACYCSTAVLTSKIIKETRKFVSIRSWSWNYLWCCYENNTFAPVVSLL